MNQLIEDAVAELSDASCSTARDKAVDAIMSRADVLRMKDMIRFNGGVVMKQLLDAYSVTDAGPATDVTQTIPKSDTSWVKDVRKQIESWGLSENQTQQRVFVFDAQNQMVRWPPDRAPMPHSRHLALQLAP